MGPTWGPSWAERTQVGPMLAPWTLLSGAIHIHCIFDSANNDSALPLFDNNECYISWRYGWLLDIIQYVWNNVIAFISDPDSLWLSGKHLMILKWRHVYFYVEIAVNHSRAESECSRRNTWQFCGRAFILIAMADNGLAPCVQNIRSHVICYVEWICSSVGKRF